MLAAVSSICLSNEELPLIPLLPFHHRLSLKEKKGSMFFGPAEPFVLLLVRQGSVRRTMTPRNTTAPLWVMLGWLFQPTSASLSLRQHFSTSSATNQHDHVTTSANLQLIDGKSRIWNGVAWRQTTDSQVSRRFPRFHLKIRRRLAQFTKYR